VAGTNFQETTGVAVVKADAVVDVPAGDIWKMLCDPNLRSKWEEHIRDFEIVQTLNPNQDIVYYTIKAPIGVTNRDFVSKRSYAANYKDFDYCMHVGATEHPSKPANKKFVRAVVINSGHCLNRISDTKTRIQMCIQTDLKVRLKSSLPAHDSGQHSKDGGQRTRRKSPKELGEECAKGVR